MTDPEIPALLQFDDLDLTGRRYGFGADTWWYEALGPNADPGNAEPITSEEALNLLIGKRARLDGYGNRQMTWPVRVCANDIRALNLGAAELERRTGGVRRVLAYEPPSGLGERTEWDVQISQAEHLFDDLDELRCRRYYNLKLTTYPFGFSDRTVTTLFGARDGSESATTIADGTSATNWTCTAGAVTTASGELAFPQVPDNPDGTIGVEVWEAAYSPPGGLNLGSSLFLRADVVFPIPAAAGGGGNLDLRLVDDDGTETQFIRRQQLGMATVSGQSGVRYRYVWRIAGGTRSSLRFRITHWRYQQAAWRLVPWRIDNVVRTTFDTAGGSNAQGIYNLVSAGSAPSPVSLSLQMKATTGPTVPDLGAVLVYSSPPMRGGYAPMTSAWLDTNTWGQVPLATLPEGTYLVCSRVDGSYTGNGNVLLEQDGADPLMLPRETQLGYRLYSHGIVNLPMANAPHDTGLNLKITTASAGAPAGGVALNGIEVFLLWLGEGHSLTVVDTGTGAPGGGRQGLWMDEPVLADLTPGLFLGDDRESAVHDAEAVKCWQILRTVDTELPVLVVATGITTSFQWCEVGLTERPAWHSFAAALPGE